MSDERQPNPEQRARLLQLAHLDEIDLTVEKLVAGGDGLGRIEGLPVFIPRSAPGDRLRVRIVERRPQYARGEIVELLQPGPGRRKPRCVHFSDCGGCDLQHLDDRLQTDLKVEAARETLRRIGGLKLPIDEQIVRGAAWGYRLRTQLHLETEPTMRIGYFARGSNRLVAIRHCPVLAPALEEFVEGLGTRLSGRIPRRLDIATGDEERITCAPPVSGLPSGEVSVGAGKHRYHFDARTFFQGHRSLLDELISTVVGEESGRTAWDLYAGVGLFAIALAERYERVVAVEGDRIAARFLRKNSRLARAGGLEAVTSSVEAAIRGLPRGADRVVVDPPRAGLGFRVRAELFERRARHLTYVSCHPAVLARDLKHLCRRYELRQLSFVDLFPQTGHLEVVAQLHLGGAWEVP